MDQEERSSFGKFRSAQRKAIRLTQDALVKTGYLETGGTFPLLVEPDVESLNPAAWARSNREWLETQLLKHGAILLRGFEGFGHARVAFFHGLFFFSARREEENGEEESQGAHRVGIYTRFGCGAQG